MDNIKIQWHPSFTSAINLKLNGYRDNLIFEKAYSLNSRPLKIDLLIIKKETCTHISMYIWKLDPEEHTWLRSLSEKPDEKIQERIEGRIQGIIKPFAI